MPSVTFVTAVAPYHTDLLPIAIESVKRQTIPCEHIIIHDTEMRGAGWARNKGLAQVKSDFVVFLDSDDSVEPAFAEHTVKAFDGYHYVYTDFIWDGKVIQSPDKRHFLEGNDQVITCLVPTVWVLAIGGFDESLLGAEDTKLFLELQAAKRCGRRLAEPLFHYGKAGRRAREFVHSMHFEPTMQSMRELRGEAMACCGENPDLPQLTEPQPGDVLARAIWGGNRSVRGFATMRQYPRTGNGKIESVHPDDVAAAPHMWQRVEEVKPFIPSQSNEPSFKVAPNTITDLNEMAAVVLGGAPQLRVQTADELRAVKRAEVKPDVAKVQALIKPTAKAGKRK